MTKITKSEARRLAISDEAEALGIPAFLTPTWRRRYGKAVAK